MISFELFGYPVNIMVGLDDYDENFKQTNQNWNVGCTAFAAFSVLWVIQLIAFTFYHSVGAVNGKGSIFGPWRNRVLFGRHTMDTVAMLGFSYMGYEALVNFGGFAAVPELIQNGAIMGVGGERAYVFSAATQRLCVMQIAYEAKNFCDSVIHNDGVVFLIHHTVTGLLAALSCRPFLHLYCAYFLGWSEIST